MEGTENATGRPGPGTDGSGTDSGSGRIGSSSSSGDTGNGSGNASGSSRGNSGSGQSPATNVAGGNAGFAIRRRSDASPNTEDGKRDSQPRNSGSGAGRSDSGEDAHRNDTGSPSALLAIADYGDWDAPARTGPGRPRTSLPPFRADAPAVETPARAPRGQGGAKKGGRRKRKPPREVRVATYRRQYQGLHEILAAFGGDRFRVSDEIAHEVAERWIDVEDAFNIVFLDKWVVLGAFVGTLAMVEIPMIKDAVLPKVMRSKKKQRQEDTGKVVSIRGDSTGRQASAGIRIP